MRRELTDALVAARRSYRRQLCFNRVLWVALSLAAIANALEGNVVVTAVAVASLVAVSISLAMNLETVWAFALHQWARAQRERIDVWAEVRFAAADVRKTMTDSSQ